MDGASHPFAAKFQHKALPDAANHMRLLRILDNNFSETIKIRCSTTTWLVYMMPSYHAISYTWGDTESNTTILINDKKFRVRTNCEFVLKQAYRCNKSYNYWIDAICIDQENLEEKSKQVGIMGNIYQTADQVLACVGAHADDSSFLFREVALTRAIREIRYERGHRAYERGRYDSKAFVTLCQQYGIFTIRRFLHAVGHFTQRPYFSRLWVVQELQNAKQAYFLCGQDTLPKKAIQDIFVALDNVFFRLPWRSQSTLISLLWSLRAMVHPRTNLEYRRSSHERLSNVYFFTTDSVYEARLFLDVKPLQCTQRRDKLYGILSILDWGDVVPPSPDYTKSDFEVALEFIQPITRIMVGKDEFVDAAKTCSDLIFLLELDERSDGVFKAIEARHGVPESFFGGPRLVVDAPYTRVRTLAKGWRVSGKPFIKHSSQSSVWKLPGFNKSRAMLPRWVREGDWILKPNTAAESELESWLLVLRAIADGVFSPIIGQGFLSSGYNTGPADSIFQVYWNVEDLIVSVIMAGCSERSVNHGVCKRQAPGSSYAIRQGYG